FIGLDLRTASSYTPAASRSISSRRSPIVKRTCTFRLLLVVVTGVVCLTQCGCLRRRMTIRTNPPGAVAFVDDQRIGVTPVSTPFTYYGTRKIQLFRDGFEPLTVKQRFPVPWYEYPPLDFIVENLWPREIRDERVVDFEMIPQQIVPNEELLGRAEMLRNNTQAGHVTPLWTPPGQPLPGTPLQPPVNQLPPPNGLR
ncbi:MAG: PEGA domain-containing protein, partial [Pirellulaceae bacterium]